MHAELAGPLHFMGRAGRANERLARHAAVVEAVAAEQVPLDEGDLAAEAGGSRG